ncbi:MAG: NGG1p interacting factor NIF3 [Elusimicrobiota bacterium]
MIVKDILKIAQAEGINADPRTEKEIKRILERNKRQYEKLSGVKKETYDRHMLESPYADTRIIYGEDKEVDQIWVGIDVDTSELNMVKNVSSEGNALVLSHHPMGRAYASFYEVMDMQTDILIQQGLTDSIAQALTDKRKKEVARKVSPSNHFKASDAAGILQIPTMCIHTPADNHVKQYLDSIFKNKNPYVLEDIIDILMEIPEYFDAALKGAPPLILSGRKNSRCGKIFVDMTGGTEGSPDLIDKLVSSGVSTVICMHMSEKHYKNAEKSNLNVIIAGHISSDNLGLNLLIDKILQKLGDIKIFEFSGFKRVSRI